MVKLRKTAMSTWKKVGPLSRSRGTLPSCPFGPTPGTVGIPPDGGQAYVPVSPLLKQNAPVLKNSFSSSVTFNGFSAVGTPGTKSGRLFAELPFPLLSEPVVTVKGSPLWKVRIGETCQPLANARTTRLEPL